MKIRWKAFLAATVLTAVVFIPCSYAAQVWNYKGFVAGWGIGKFSRSFDPQLGLRFVPEFSISRGLGDNFSLDAAFSLNAVGELRYSSSESVQTEGSLSPYRLWVRFSSSQFEARLGLQKINFGSASLFRPLMWFDSLDPRDPLQFTEGVKGLLLRYYFLNNANMWIWGLVDNDKLKGWETIPSVKGGLEYGGRLQVPLFTGELAVSYHHRRIDIGRSLFPVSSRGDLRAPEDRWGLDGKWDVGIGVWIEASLIRQKASILPQPWRKAVTLGMDATLNIGNGLTLLVEQFRLEASRKAFSSGEGIDYSAFMLRYPVNILDEISGMVYYDWKNKGIYRFLQWQRTYDTWDIHVMAFWNPDVFLAYQNLNGSSPFIGKGFQIMVVFNY